MGDRKPRSDKGKFKDTGRVVPDVVTTFRLSPGHKDYVRDEEAADYLATFNGEARRVMLTEAILMHKYQDINIPAPQNEQVEGLMDQLRDLVDKLLNADLQVAPGKKKKAASSSIPTGYLMNLKQMLNPGSDED